MTETNVLAVKEVFERRSMYDAVVDGNYMHHAELFAALGAWSKRFARPLRIVDLGCGDASLATVSFRTANVERYVGIDLAESSIEQATAKTAAWGDRVELICGNLFDRCKRCQPAAPTRCWRAIRCITFRAMRSDGC